MWVFQILIRTLKNKLKDEISLHLEILVAITTVHCNHCYRRGTCLVVRRGLLKRRRYSCNLCITKSGFEIGSASVVPCSICKGVGKITKERFAELYET